MKVPPSFRLPPSANFIIPVTRFYYKDKYEGEEASKRSVDPEAISQRCRAFCMARNLFVNWPQPVPPRRAGRGSRSRVSNGFIDRRTKSERTPMADNGLASGDVYTV